MVLHRIPSLMKGLVGKWKQLFILRSLSLDGGILLIVLCRDDTSLAFTSNRKCCSHCIKTVNNICTGLRLMVSANFLCPIAISDSQKPLKLRDARPVSLAGCRRLILINMISNAASVKPKSVRRHRLQNNKIIEWYTLHVNRSKICWLYSFSLSMVYNACL